MPNVRICQHVYPFSINTRAYYDFFIPSIKCIIYLGSGLIKGIGPVIASRIVKEFGEHTLEVLDRNIDRLEEVAGIGGKRIAMIKTAWEDQKEIRAIMIFLQEHGVGLGHATKIYRRYGQRSVAVVSQNPYRMATEITGIGFQTADRIAGELGFEKDAPVRAEAGILYTLDQMAQEGHVYYPYELLIEKCRETLNIEKGKIVEAAFLIELTFLKGRNKLKPYPVFALIQY